MKLSLTPAQAWRPIAKRRWTRAHARHLLRRASWAVLPEQLEAATRDGPFTTVRRLFAAPPPVEMPASVAVIAAEREEYRQRVRATDDPEERRRLQREARQQANAAFQEMTLDWLRLASDPRHAPYEKWVTFLQNIFVVSFDRVRQPDWIFNHHDLLRQNATGTYPDLCRAVSRSPAMILYLDLQLSRSSAPNENFARELFELFLLGEGNYTETDIKEAARAFTGYRHRDGEFFLARNQQDRSQKTIFGRTGRWTGDDVIRLAFDEEAASRFLPGELCRFYLSEDELPAPYLEALGAIWREADFDLGVLLNRFFTSRIFYEEPFRGNLIKSPLHFHLGLIQDLRLTIPPFPRAVLTSYRQMGQDLYNPPNVRGWVGGQLWINSSTLSARRHLVESLFQPLREDRLNADEQAALRSAREERPVTLAVTPERLDQLSQQDPAAIADQFIHSFLPRPPGPDYRRQLIAYLTGGNGSPVDRIRTVATAMLQSAEYNLC